MNLLLLLMTCFATVSPCASEDCEDEEDLHLSLNISEGAYLQFSDGKTYEIDPEDRIYSSFWITPFPAEITPSNDPNYPVQITNLYTGTVVKGKEVSTREILKREQEKTKSLPPPKVEPKQPLQEQKKQTPPKKPEPPKPPPKPQATK